MQQFYKNCLFKNQIITEKHLLVLWFRYLVILSGRIGGNKQTDILTGLLVMITVTLNAPVYQGLNELFRVTLYTHQRRKWSPTSDITVQTGMDSPYVWARKVSTLFLWDLFMPHECTRVRWWYAHYHSSKNTELASACTVVVTVICFLCPFR